MSPTPDTQKAFLFLISMSKGIYIKFLLQFLAWILFFQLTRLVFVVYNLDGYASLPTSELLRLPIAAIYLDTAMSCYFMGIPFLLFAAAIFSEKPIFLTFNRYFTNLLIVLVSIITIAELPLFDEWQSKLNYKAVAMLDTPSEVVRTATNAQLLGGTLAIIALSLFGIWLFGAMSGKAVKPQRKPFYLSIPFALLTPGLIAIGLRGGLQQIPIQVSDAYFSKHNLLNTAATNSTFNLLSSCLDNRKAGKPYQFLPKDEAAAIFSTIRQPELDTTVSIFTTNRPNIVLIILESWTADLMSNFGGFEGVAPNLEQMAREGFAFKNCYASGLRSDQGMAAIFSGFPAQPRTSIIKQPDKFEQLPCINTSLKQAGYSTSFLFGGQLSYGNIRSYLYFNGFDRITEGKDFDSSIPTSKLGVPDEYLFERQLAALDKERTPFFAAMFTLSSHSPYDVPMEQVIDWGGKEQSFLNSALYVDRCIGDFMKKARETDWYKNTAFVFIADHGHTSPKNWQYNQPELRRIPLLLYGEAIKPAFRGVVDTLPCSQTDVAATLLAQLQLPTSFYKYSTNLFNPTCQRHAFYSIDEGFCFVKPASQLCWHVQNGMIEFVKPEGEPTNPQHLKEGKSYLQTLMDDYFGF